MFEYETKCTIWRVVFENIKKEQEVPLVIEHTVIFLYNLKLSAYSSWSYQNMLTTVLKVVRLYI